MKIQWVNTAGLLLADHGTVIAFDPFLGMTPVYLGFRKRWASRYRRVKHVFVTHGHFDHIYDIPRLYRGTETKIYATKTPLMTLRKKGLSQEQLVLIAPGMHLNIGSMDIFPLQSRHCRFDAGIIKKTICRQEFWQQLPSFLKIATLQPQYRENGEILFYEITNKEGQRVQVLGSMNLCEDVDYPTGADLLILALQGRSDQDTYALKIVEKLKPKRILIDHIDNSFPPMTQEVDVSGFVRNVEQMGIPCEAMERGKTVVI